MAEQLISSIQFQGSLYTLKDAQARKELDSRLYSHIYDLTISEKENTVNPLLESEMIYDPAVNAYKCIGTISIEVPHLADYEVLLTTIPSSDGTVTCGTDTYAIGSSVYFTTAYPIKFILSNYTWIKSIKVNEILSKHITKVSLLENDKQYLTGYVENENLIFNY